MVHFSHLVRFEAEEDGEVYYSDLGRDADGPPALGTKLNAFRSFEDLENDKEGRMVTVGQVSVYHVDVGA